MLPTEGCATRRLFRALWTTPSPLPSMAPETSGFPGNSSGYNGTTMVELIGIAVPVVTPISPNYPGKSGTNGLGVRP